MNNSVCFNCNNRTPNCHSHCPAYAEERRANLARYAEHMAQYEAGHAAHVVNQNAVKRARKEKMR